MIRPTVLLTAAGMPTAASVASSSASSTGSGIQGARGRRAWSRVDSRTAIVFFVAGEDAGGKLDQARALGIETVTPEEFAERLAGHL